MVNDKIVNDLVMEKKIYISPLMEVEQIDLTGLLMGSPVTPITPPGPSGAPRIQTPVLGNDSVPVF